MFTAEFDWSDYQKSVISVMVRISEGTEKSKQRRPLYTRMQFLDEMDVGCKKAEELFQKTLVAYPRFVMTAVTLLDGGNVIVTGRCLPNGSGGESGNEFNLRAQLQVPVGIVPIVFAFGVIRYAGLATPMEHVAIISESIDSTRGLPLEARKAALSVLGARSPSIENPFKEDMFKTAKPADASSSSRQRSGSSSKSGGGKQKAPAAKEKSKDNVVSLADFRARGKSTPATKSSNGSQVSGEEALRNQIKLNARNKERMKKDRDQDNKRTSRNYGLNRPSPAHDE